MIAHILVSKYLLGVPFYRLEQQFALQGVSLDRGTMCRSLEEVGNVLGATVVHAMMRDAIEHCAVLSTDAPGAAIQPGPRHPGTEARLQERTPLYQLGALRVPTVCFNLL